ncbi:MAG: rhomboid family intramembrane serine protease [Ardenticatenales bacterium]|nr:rhomboid family intramembrane serine protease [Ardenticatenales bacterium]
MDIELPDETSPIRDDPPLPGPSLPEPARVPSPLPPPATATLGPLRRRQADGWSLVLSSEGIGHQLLSGTDGLYLAVDAGDAVRASASLQAYMTENDAPVFDTARRPPLRPSADPAGRADLGFGIAAGLALLAGFAVTGDATHGGGLAPLGGADSGLILNGALWRTVTALTLHAGIGHVLANALASVIFLPLAARRLGIGLTLLGTIGAGAIGNWLTAYLRGPGSLGVGFSTAVFGALGLLAGARLVDGDRGGRGGCGGCWIVFGAAMALLALLGSGEQSDVLAHACGLVAGVPIGAAIARFARAGAQAHGTSTSVAGARLQWAAGIAAVAIIAGAWGLALR